MRLPTESGKEWLFAEVKCILRFHGRLMAAMHVHVCQPALCLQSFWCCMQVPAAASGLIAGDGLWSIPSAILAICKVQAPICMSFARAGTI